MNMYDLVVNISTGKSRKVFIERQKKNIFLQNIAIWAQRDWLLREENVTMESKCHKINVSIKLWV